MGEAIAVLGVLVFLGVLVLLPILALVQASQARNEARRLRDELRRLERRLDGGRRIGEAAAPPAGAPAPPAGDAALPAGDAALPAGEAAPSAGDAALPAGAPAPPAGAPASRAAAALHRVHATMAAPDPPAEEVSTVPAPAAGAEDLLPIPPPGRTPGTPPSAPVSLENFLGGRVFLVAGILFALLGLGWFLKVAIDRDWIGPGMRVAIGVAAGIAAQVLGERLRAKGYGVFGHGLMGGGLGALYVTTYFASVRYGFLDRTPAFAVMGLLTAGGAAWALFREAPLLAYLGFLGGFLAPGLLSTGEDRLWGLAGWLAVLDAGILAATARRRWPGLDLMAVVAAAGYFTAWEDRFGSAHPPGFGSAALAFLTVLALAAALAPPILRREAPAATALFAAFLAGLFGVVAAAHLLHPLHRRALGAAAAGLAILYGSATRLVRTRCAAPKEAAALLALALAALAAAVPFVFEGRGVAPAWAATGLALLVVASRGAPDLVGYGGAGMAALAALEALSLERWRHDPGAAPFANAAFLCILAPAASFVAGGFALGRTRGGEFPVLLRLAGTWLLAACLGSEAWQSARCRGEDALPPAAAAAAVAVSVLAAAGAWRGAAVRFRAAVTAPMAAAALLFLVFLGEGRRGEFAPVLNGVFALGAAAVAASVAAGALTPGAVGRVLQVAGLAGLFVLGTWEILHWGSRCALDGGTRRDAEFASQVIASVAWAVYAALLLVAGFARARADLRWAGIVLFGLTAGKVFLYDMATLDIVYRIGSFLVLGLLLVGASFLYQKRRAADA